MEYDEAEMLDANTFIREGWDFRGWKDAGGAAYADLAEVVNLTAEDGSEVMLYAQWERIPLKVTYVDGHTGSVIDVDDVFWGDGSTHPSIPAHTGYKAIGWDVTDLSRITEDTLVKVSYEPIAYRVLFNGGAPDAQGHMEAQPMEYDLADTLFRNSYSRTGYRFVGWKDASGNAYTDAQEVVNLTAEDGGEVTLYAQWEALPAPETPEQQTPAQTTPASTPTSTTTSVPATGTTTSAPSVADLAQTGAGATAAGLGVGGILAAIAAATRRKRK